MGKRVHVIKRHEDYGTYAAFNWMYEEFSDFLDNLGCEVYRAEYVVDNFECEVDKYKTALKLVNSYKKYGRCEKVEKMFDDADADIDSFEDRLEELGGLNYILEAMEAYWKERDKKSSWISFSAW